MRLLWLCWLCYGWMWAQAPAEFSGSGGPNLPAQAIGPDDLLAIAVYDSPELTRSVRVGSDGDIRLPMLERRIHVDGLLPVELEQAVAEALRAEKLLVNPIVTVTIAEYHSRPIRVAGAVKRPLTFQAYSSVTLLDALTRAEGLSPEAGAEILVTRTRPGENGAPAGLTERIAVRSLIGGANPALNVKLVGGEEIRVPEAGRVYVLGNVHKPGMYVVKDATDTTVLKILAQAEGLAPFASNEAYIYRRETDGGAKHEIPIPLSRIIERKAPDVALTADDILYIPDNKNRRLTVSALERIAGFGAATASGVLIWRR